MCGCQKGKRDPQPNLTGLYLRYYDKIARGHSYALLLYGPEELQGMAGTMHLRALQKFREEYGCKVSFCIGFALGENLVVKGNSCSNVRTGDSRALDEDRYQQLMAIMRQRNWKVTTDDASTMDNLTAGMSKLNLKKK